MTILSLISLTNDPPAKAERLLSTAERVIRAFAGTPTGATSPEDALEDAEQAWTVASQVGDDDYPRVRAGIDLALRRAQQIQTRGEPDQSGARIEGSYEDFIAQSVRDADKIRTSTIEVLEHLGWTRTATSVTGSELAYQAAMVVAEKAVSRFASNTAMANDALHQAIINVIHRFARMTEPIDIPNPRGYAYQAVRNAATDLFRRRHEHPADLPSDWPADAGPGPEVTAMAAHLFPQVRLDLSCRLFGGLIRPQPAALLLGLMSAAGEGALLESWPWGDSPTTKSGGQSNNHLKYLVLRKCDPDHYTPHDGSFDSQQRQAAKSQIAMARYYLDQVLP